MNECKHIEWYWAFAPNTLRAVKWCKHCDQPIDKRWRVNSE